jgi:hypothetical protein
MSDARGEVADLFAVLGEDRRDIVELLAMGELCAR